MTFRLARSQPPKRGARLAPCSHPAMRGRRQGVPKRRALRIVAPRVRSAACHGSSRSSSTFEVGVVRREDLVQHFYVPSASVCRAGSKRRSLSAWSSLLSTFALCLTAAAASTSKPGASASSPRKPSASRRAGPPARAEEVVREQREQRAAREVREPAAQVRRVRALVDRVLGGREQLRRLRARVPFRPVEVDALAERLHVRLGEARERRVAVTRPVPSRRRMRNCEYMRSTGSRSSTMSRAPRARSHRARARARPVATSESTDASPARSGIRASAAPAATAASVAAEKARASVFVRLARAHAPRGLERVRRVFSRSSGK